MSTAESALSYRERGWHPLALHHALEDGSCSCGAAEDGHAVGKHPRERGWQRQAAPSRADVYTLWERWPEANVGIATGEASGFWVLDVDAKHGGDLALKRLEAEHGDLPATHRVRTPSGGFHLYWLLPQGVRIGCSPGRLPEGLDVRGNGGQVVAPPSTTPAGAYVVDDDRDPVDAPSWLVELIRPKAPEVREPSEVVVRATEEVERYVSAVVEAEVARVHEARNGERNHALNRATFALATIAAHEDSGLSPEVVSETMEAAGLAAGLPLPEVRRTVESGLRGGLDKPREPWPPADPHEALAFLDFEETEPTLGTWGFVDPAPFLDGTYEEEVPTVLPRTDGRHLFYRGRTHVLYGESESGKSWVALHACAQELKKGERVVFLDFEEVPKTIYRRLAQLGVPADALRERFFYTNPDEAIAKHREPFLARLEAIAPSLVILDGMTDAMRLHSLDLLDADDIGTWDALIPAAIAKRTNAAVASVDHTPKGGDTQLGSQHKKNRVSGTSYFVEKKEEFARGSKGWARLTVKKDRPGAVREFADQKKYAGEFHLDGTDPDTLVAELRPQGAKPEFRPTGVMQKIGHVLQEAGGELPSQAAVEKAVGGNAERVREAIAALVRDGFVERIPGGPGKGVRHVLVQPYEPLAFDPAAEVRAFHERAAQITNPKETP